MNGSWSGTGCSLIQSDEQQVTCSCNHLTNFAVLMQVGDKTVGKIMLFMFSNLKQKRIIKYTGMFHRHESSSVIFLSDFSMTDVDRP